MNGWPIVPCPECKKPMHWHEWIATVRCTNSECQQFDRWKQLAAPQNREAAASTQDYRREPG